VSAADPWPVGSLCLVIDHDSRMLPAAFQVARSYWPKPCVELRFEVGDIYGNSTAAKFPGLIRQNHDRMVPIATEGRGGLTWLVSRIDPWTHDPGYPFAVDGAIVDRHTDGRLARVTTFRWRVANFDDPAYVLLPHVQRPEVAA
jgi:hypothetical protein